MKIVKENLGFLSVLFLLAVFFALTGCADKELIAPCLSGHEYGFLGGLWHGIIAPVGFIGMLVRDDVVMYASNNNGAWYAFGFLLGSGGWGFLASRSSRR